MQEPAFHLVVQLFFTLKFGIHYKIGEVRGTNAYF